MPVVLRSSYMAGKNTNQRGFTLIELLIVVAIIGILAAIAIPNLLTAMQRARAKRTMADMRTIGQAWEAYAIENNGYSAAGVAEEPGVDSSDEYLPLTYDELTNMLTPDYIKKLPQHDGWGNEFVFARTANGKGYMVVSTGADGEVSSGQSGLGDGVGGTGSGAPPPTGDFDTDIYFINGNFTSTPIEIPAPLQEVA
jgi:general secretion pathway protein G